MASTGNADSLSPGEIRTLLRECATVVRPGEILVIRAGKTWDVTPNQVRDLQDYVDWWLNQNAPEIKALVIIGDGGQVIAPETQGGEQDQD